MAVMPRNELRLGGMVLKRRVGGVDIEPAGGGGSVRIQDADMAEVVAFLSEPDDASDTGPSDDQ